MKNELLILVGILLLALLLIASGGPRSSESKDKTVTATITTSSVWDPSKPLKEIDLSNRPHLRQGEITIYFEPEQRRLAQEVAQALKEGWQLVARRLGIALGAFGVALIALSETERAEIGGIYLKQRVQVKQPLGSLLQWPPETPKPPFPVEVPPDLQSLKGADLETQESIYCTMPHEALHGAVSRALDRGLDQGWRFDPQTRGLEEGLAEYVGHLVAKKLSPEAHRSHLEKRQKEVQKVLQGRERPTYDLTQEFLQHIEVQVGEGSSQTPSPTGPTPTELAGYGVSLAFWLQIAQKHGEGVIKTFWQRLNQRGFPNAKEAARILSELTGEDIWAKLQNMDLHEVLRTLEQAARE